jgi:hypothetical protein
MNVWKRQKEWCLLECHFGADERLVHVRKLLLSNFSNTRLMKGRARISINNKGPTGGAVASRQHFGSQNTSCYLHQARGRQKEPTY